MKIIRQENFEHRGKRYQIVVENDGPRLKATAVRNGKRVRRSEVLSGLDDATGYDTTAGMISVDQLIVLAQNKLRDRVS